MIQRNIFTKVEQPADYPHVWVSPAFYGLDFDTKQNFANVVWAYHFDGTESYHPIVVLYDSKTGKQIGTFEKTLKLN